MALSIDRALAVASVVLGLAGAGAVVILPNKPWLGASWWGGTRGYHCSCLDSGATV